MIAMIVKYANALDRNPPTMSEVCEYIGHYNNHGGTNSSYTQ